MKTTAHAEMRLKQRAIPYEVAQLIAEEGVAVSGAGGATFYRIPEGVCKTRSEQCRREARLWEKAKNKAVLAKGETIITVMPRYKKLFLLG